MASEWPKRSLKELGVTLIDCVHKTPAAVENGIPYIGIPQMDNGRINFDAEPRLISESDFVKWTEKANPKYGDVVLSRRCNPGETAYVPRDAKFALGQNLVLLRPEGKEIHPEFLRWAVQGKEWWDEVERYKNPGAIFDSLKCADIPKFQIPFPPVVEQKKISRFLSSISGKIELNRQINQTLEQIAQALFKSWFVDFDPVIDNALAAGNPIPDELQERAERRQQQRAKPEHQPLPEHIRQLFPSEFELTESLGWVPKGWTIRALDEIATKLKTLTIELDIKDGDVIFSWSGTLMIDIWCGGKAALNQHLFKVSSNDYPRWFYYLQTLSHLENFQRIASDKAVTMGHIKRGDLSNAKCLVPSSDIINMTTKILEPLIEKKIESRLGSNQLTLVRDTLLPKLISGELRIPETQSQIEQALA